MHQQLQSSTPGFRYDPTQLQADPMTGWEPIALAGGDPFEIQLRAYLEAIVTGAPAKTRLGRRRAGVGVGGSGVRISGARQESARLSDHAGEVEECHSRVS